MGTARTATPHLPRCRRRRVPRLRRPSRLLVLLLSSLGATLAAAQIVPPAATALPAGGRIMVGAGQINRNGAQMVIDQSSARLGIDWQRFDIGSAASVEFRQPGASAIALNRIVGNDASAIYGRLSANGQVFLTNTNGVLFAPGARVDVGALVASTLDLSQQDFAAGLFRFRDGGSAGSVVNRGTLAAAPGGYLALFGREVANDGEMTVRAGSVLLASGRAATVAINDSGLLSAVVDPGAAGRIGQRGLIDAPGSTVTMTARSAEGVAASLVNNAGIVRASAIVERGGEVWITGDTVANSGTIAADGGGALAGGRIVLLGDMARGEVKVGGTLSATAAGGDGGFIETSAARVTVADDARVRTASASGRSGTWLIDPNDYRIAASGGDISGAQLGVSLGGGNVTIRSSDGAGGSGGNIVVDDAVSWSANKLTLSAHNDIQVNAALAGSGSASLGFEVGQGAPAAGNAGKWAIAVPVTLPAGAGGFTSKVGNDGVTQSYTVVTTLAGLQAIDASRSGNFALGAAIDASASAASDGGLGFNPIGDETTTSTSTANSYSGSFDGLGNTISGLTVNRPAAAAVGLFASMRGAAVRNLTLAGGSMTGRDYVGGLAGVATDSTIDQVAAGGNVTGNGAVGGLIGMASGTGAVTHSSASGNVTGAANAGSVGGLVGNYNLGAGQTGNAASGTVSGGYHSGGLIGFYDSAAAVTDGSYSGGSVSGGTWAGGLIGYMNQAAGITGASPEAPLTVAANVTAGGNAGGMVGRSNGAVANVNASGDVAGAGNVGGLIGQADGAGGISYASASGKVTETGTGNAGGLVGLSTTAIANSSASGNVQGSYQAGGLVGWTRAAVADSSASGKVSATRDSTVYAGGLIGYASCYSCNGSTQVSNSSASGAVAVDAGSAYAGGLIGLIESGSIDRASASGHVTATDRADPDPRNGSHYAGGLVGYFGEYSNAGSITRSNATGTVSGRYAAGGLVGYFWGNSISDSGAAGAVSGTYYVGGLVGYGYANGPLTNVSASGNVVSVLGGAYSPQVGGLFGQLYLQGGALTGAFASGSVTNTSTDGDAGGLVGYLYFSSAASGVNDSAATGKVSGGDSAGGLVGSLYDYSGTGGISNSRASGDVSAANYAGGLVGTYYRAARGSADDISNSWASGNVASGRYAGGLVGDFSGSKGIRGSWASGDVTGLGSGWGYLGGLVGDFYAASPDSTTPSGAITLSWASGNVTLAPSATLAAYSPVYAGGLVGYLAGSTTSAGPAIADAYASGNVVLDSAVGALYAAGLVGRLDGQQITRSYAGGRVAVANGTSRAAGGLVAAVSGSGAGVSSSYWDGEVTGQTTSAGGGSALTHAQMLQSASFAGWDIANRANAGRTWRSYDGHTAPLLAGMLTPLALTLADASKPYDGTTSFGHAALAGVSHPERIYASVASPDVGSYPVGAAGVYSVQNGYDLSVAGSAQLTITKRPITLDGVVADKVYDGTRNASFVAAGQPAGLVAGEDLRIDTSTASAQFDTRNVGQDKPVTISGLTLADGVHGKASNYLLANAGSARASIAPAPLAVGGFSAADRAYDGSTTVAVTAAPSGSVVGKFAGDDVSADVSAVTSGTIADKNVGTAKPVTVLGAVLSGADAGNYRIAGIDTVTVNVTPKALTINGISGIDQTYSAATTVSVSTSNATLSGVVSGDSVQLVAGNVSGSMADKNVVHDSSGKPAAKPVTVSGSAFRLRGTDAANYAVQDASASATISPASISVYAYRDGQTDRVYDGTAAANVGVDWYYAPFSGDQVSFTKNPATYSDKSVAYDGSGKPAAKTITVGGIALSGSDAGNYVLGAYPIQKDSSGNYYVTTTGTISPKPLAVSGVAAVDRAYNGTVNVEVDVGSATVDTSAVIAGDTVGVTLPGSGKVVGTMADKNAGASKAVKVPGFALTGADAGNYTLAGAGAGVTVNIAKKDLTATYSGVDKVYDGSAYAGVGVGSADVVAGDQVYYTAAQAYYYCGGTSCSNFFATAGSTPSNYTPSRDAGTGKTVVVTRNALYGADAANYNLLNPTATTTATITPKPVTLAFKGIDKVYDGTDTASVTLDTGASGIYGVDTVSVSDSAVFSAGRNAGTGKAIAVSDIVLGGPDAGNYALASTTGSATASITPKTLTITGLAGVDRPYDGTTVVAVQSTGPLGASGVVANDRVDVTAPEGGATSGTVATKDAGSNREVTVTGLALAGADAANYTLAGSGVTVNITPRRLTASYVGVDRPYNGGVSAQVVGVSADIVDGDTVTFSQSAVFTGIDARDVGTAKPIAVSNIRVGGADAANYALANASASTTANVTGKTIIVAYSGVDRVYNGVGDTSAQVNGGSTGVVAGDLVTFTQSAVFRGDGAVGRNKAIDVSGITLGGAQAGNYTLAATTATTTASITPRPIGIAGIRATGRSYDGTTTVAIDAAGATIDTSGVIPGDQVSVVLPAGGISTGTLDSKDAGSNRTVHVSGLSLAGASAANYSVGDAAGLTVNIAPLPLTAVYGAADKVYDGNARASVTWTSGDVLAADLPGLGIAATGVFTAGKNAGSGKTVAISGGYLTGSERNNYVLDNPSGTATATISPLVLSATYRGGSKVYDGTVAAPVSGTAAFIAGDDVRLTETAVFTDGKNAGNRKPVAVSAIALAGSDAGNYALADTTAGTYANVTPKPLAITGLVGARAVDRVYDGTRTVDVVVTTSGALAPSSADIVGADDVTIHLPAGGITTGSMADKNAGTRKPVVVDGLSLSGADAVNYAIAATSGIAVDIARKPLTAAYAGLNKVYDGTDAASAGGDSADIVDGDRVTIGGRGNFTGGKGVGPAKAISIASAQLAGTDAGNYLLVNPTGSASADIVPKPITATYTGGSKVYDGNAIAPVASTTAGFVAGDEVALGQDAVFSLGRNVVYDAAGNPAAQPIAITGIALAGGDAANYALTASSAAASGTITPKPLRIDGLTGVVAVDRVYDATTTVAVNVQTSGPVAPHADDLVGADVVTVSAPANGVTTGTMQDKRVGSVKPVTVNGLALVGADAGNYRIAAASGVTVDITPRPLRATYAGVDRVYDGTAAATVAATSADIFAGDAVTFSTTAVFTDGKNAGTGKPIAVSAASLGGADAVNYHLVNPSGSATASVRPKVVNASYAGGTRVYDGTIAAPVTATVGGFIAGDDVALGQTAVFTGAGAKNVGTNKPVQISGAALSGADAANYTLVTGSLATAASITPRPITVDGLTDVKALDRSYDGTTTVAVQVNRTGSVGAHPGDIIAGDDVTVHAPQAGQTTGQMQDKNVGTGKAVAVAGLTLSGADAANYRVVAADGVTVTITPRPISAAWGGANKVYDGSDAALLTGSSPDLIAGDAVGFAASGTFSAGKGVGIGKTVVFSDGSLSGADAGNYRLTNPSGSIVADIAPRNVNASYIGGTKVYDGTANAPVTLASTSGLVAGDDVQLDATAVFSGAGAKNVGSGKPVQISPIVLRGADAPNYNLVNSSATTTATITPKLVTIGGIDGIGAVDRVYDGTREVALTLAPGSGGSATTGDFIAGDDVALAGSVAGQTTGLMLDKNAGADKPVSVAGLTLTGADAGNYLIAGIRGVSVNIAPLTVRLTGLKPLDRVYDGTREVALDTGAATLDGTIPGDAVAVAAAGATGRMADKNAGLGKAVQADGTALTGSDAGNYRLATGDLRVDIAPRPLTPTYVASSRVYDGTTAVTVAATSADIVAGDDVAVSGSGAFTGPGAKDVGNAKPVTVTRVALSGADAGNYQLASTSATTTASITPAPLAITASDFAKTYGDGFSFTGSEFSAAGLAAGETAGRVALASAGAAATAGVGDYAITASAAAGGSFDPANYTLTYREGRLAVTPRPLVVAANTVVRPAGDPAPLNPGFSTNAGGLVNGDAVTAATIPVPPGYRDAMGGSVFALTPSAADLGRSAPNYAVSYQDGLLVVLPRPPAFGEVGASADAGSGNQVFVVSVSPEELARALQALDDAAAVTAQSQPAALRTRPMRKPPAGSAPTMTSDSGEGARPVSLSDLLGQPLIALDPRLRRLVFGAE